MGLGGRAKVKVSERARVAARVSQKPEDVKFRLLSLTQELPVPPRSIDLVHLRAGKLQDT